LKVYYDKMCIIQKNATLRTPSESTGVWRRQLKGLATLINRCVMSWRPEWNLIWLYVRSATRDQAHCSPQMTRSTRLTTAIQWRHSLLTRVDKVQGPLRSKGPQVLRAKICDTKLSQTRYWHPTHWQKWGMLWH